MANTVDEGDQRQEEKSMGCWEMGDGRWGGGERTLRCLLLKTAIAWGEKSWSRSTATVSISPGPAAACAYLRPAQ